MLLHAIHTLANLTLKR